MKLKWVNLIIMASLFSGCCNQKHLDDDAMERHSEQNRVKQLKSPILQEASQRSLNIHGHVPKWLNGTFVRNGPVSMQIDNEKQNHWFDGLAMLHAFSFQDGKITYSNKFLKTDPYHSVFTKGSFSFLGFDTITKHPILERIEGFFRSKSCPGLQNANVNVAKIANHYVALTEIPLPVEFDLKDLQTLDALRFQDALPKELVFDSAHPKMDGKTGEQFNYLVDYGFNSKYVIYRYHPEKPCRERIGEISVKKPAYMHSFALTQNYFILVEFPLVVNPIDIMFMTKPFIQNYCWESNRGTNFLVIDRRSGKLVKKLRVDRAFFAFHHVNAYEENEKIILDMVSYSDASIIPDISQHGYLSRHFVNKNLPLSKLTRYFLSLKNNTIEEKILFDGQLELPRINEKYTAYAYRYIYGSDQRLLTQPKDLRPIYKINTLTGEKQSWEEAGVLPGEPVFIARPGSKDEDDGIVVNIVLDVGKQNAFLLLLDGKTFKELGRAYAPFVIPIGLHGQFFRP